jgi:hypothetical protein
MGLPAASCCQVDPTAQPQLVQGAAAAAIQQQLVLHHATKLVLAQQRPQRRQVGNCAQYAGILNLQPAALRAQHKQLLLLLLLLLWQSCLRSAAWSCRIAGCRT